MISPEDNVEVVRGLASPVRLQILHLLRQRAPSNVNEISARLGLPQSTIATNVQILESTGLIRTELVKASKGQQKICSARFDEIVIRLDGSPAHRQDNIIEVAMPLGLYTGYQVSAPCGLCSTEGIIGLLDVPDHFVDPSRMQASLVWFGRGYLEYKFPNMPPNLRTPARDWSILPCRDDNDRPPRRCRRPPTTRRHERRIPLRP